MSFSAFLATIESAELRALAEHWHAARGRKYLPAWRDIDPVMIGPSLRYVWSWKYDRQSNAFTGRLAGEEIDRVFGKSLRGAPMDAFFGPDAFRIILPRQLRVVNEPALMRGHGLVFIQFERMLVGERIALPLSEDGVLGDGIIGATRYLPGPPAETEKQLGFDATAEQVAFFPLDPA